METIVKQIETSLLKNLVPFLAKKFNENGIETSTETISEYVSEWLGKDTTKKSKTSPPKKSQPKKSKIITEKKYDDFENVKLTKEILEPLTLKKLQELCKLRTLTSSGTKATLQERLLNYQQSLDENSEMVLVREAEKSGEKKENISEEKDLNDDEVYMIDKKIEARLSSSEEEDIVNNKIVKKSKKKSPRKIKTNIHRTKKPSIIENIEKKRKEIILDKDEYGNGFDTETGFVFNKENEVVGKKDKSGTIRDLTEEDIKLCKDKNMEYIYPFNIEEDDDEDFNIEED